MSSSVAIGSVIHVMFSESILQFSKSISGNSCQTAQQHAVILQSREDSSPTSCGDKTSVPHPMTLKSNVLSYAPTQAKQSMVVMSNEFSSQKKLSVG